VSLVGWARRTRRILEWFAFEVVRNATSTRPQDRHQGVVFGFGGVRSCASFPIIRDEQVRELRLVSCYGVK